MEKNEIKFLKNNIKKGDIILDIGANIGFYSLLLSEITGEQGIVYAFEPEKNNFNKLLQNTKHRKNIHCINAAVSDKSGKIDLYSSEYNLNVDFRTYYTARGKKKATIDTYSIDDFMQKFSVPKINWIKIDIQGYEYFAFKGMTESLKKYPTLKILTEFWPYGIKQAGISMNEWYDLIKHLNLKVFMLENNVFEDMSEFDWNEFSEMPPDKYFTFLLTQ